MPRRNLQNDNKIRKSSFFDIDAAAEREADLQEKEEHSAAPCADIKEEKRFKRRTYIAIAVIAALLCAAIIISGIDLVLDGELIGIFKNEPEPTQYDNRYKADWETDIFTSEEYLELNPHSMMYSSNGGYVIYEVGPQDIESAPVDVKFFYEYFDAIKRGDRKKYNSFFTTEGLKENEKKKNFPMQKIYNIEIVKYDSDASLDKKYGEGKYSLYAIKYNIYKNDGLFCAEVDERHAREEVAVLVYDDYGNAKIDVKKDGKYYI